MKTQIVNLAQRFKGNDLRAKCARSSVILGFGTIADKGLAFLSKLILVRLLVPEEMGLMVLILSLTGFFETLTEVGIKQSVIQHKNGAMPGYLNMAWWFQSVRAICLYSAAFIAVPMVCRFYFEGKSGILDNHSYQELILLVRVAFLSILFNGFISPRAHVLEKEFKFGKSVVIIQGSAIIGTAITIAMAFTYRNAWAMVIGFASMAMLRCLFSFILCPIMPRFEFDKRSFSDLFCFARGMFGLPILTYIAYNIDVLVGGKMVSTDILGMYGMAFALARIPHELFMRIIAPTLLPAFAEKQDDSKALSAAVLKLSKMTALFTVPAVTLAVLFSKTILSIVYGPDFSLVAISFAFLCLYVILQLQGSILSSVLFAIGMPAKHRLFLSVRVVLLLLSIYPSIKFAGMSGAAFSVFLATAIALSFQLMVIRKTIGLSIRRYLLSWLHGIAVSVIVFLIVVVLRVTVSANGLFNLIVGSLVMLVAIGMTFYIEWIQVIRANESSK